MREDRGEKEDYRSYEELPLMLTVLDVAVVLGISRAGNYELVKSDGFLVLKIGNQIVLPKDKFLLWIKKQCGEKS